MAVINKNEKKTVRVTKDILKVTTKRSSSIRSRNNDKIIVSRGGFHKEIPALIFSAKEAQTLLEFVDKVTNKANSNRNKM